MRVWTAPVLATSQFGKELGLACIWSSGQRLDRPNQGRDIEAGLHKITPERFAEFNQTLNDAIDRLPRNDSPTLTRVMGGNPQQVMEFVTGLKAAKGKPIVMDTYLSTSRLGGKYDPGSTKAVITIKARPGSRASAKVDHLSDFPGEKKTLYKHGTRFKVIKVVIKRPGDPHQIELEELE